jgi:cytidine deaminase
VAIIITLHVFFKARKNALKKVRILSNGFNQMGGFNKMGELDTNNPGVHAEEDAINKLKPNPKMSKNNKNLEKVDMLVIRFSRNNKLQESKPCANCIQHIKQLPYKKGYKIKNIYYSNNNGDIVKTTLSKLENEELHYSKFYRRYYNTNSFQIL